MDNLVRSIRNKVMLASDNYYRRNSGWFENVSYEEYVDDIDKAIKEELLKFLENHNETTFIVADIIQSLKF